MSKNLELAKDYFERHSNSECFITADGRVFHTPGTAEGFATTLEDKTVEKFSRSQFNIVIDNVEKVYEDALGEDDLVIKLSTFDAETATYEDAKALVKELGLETASQKKEDLFVAIATQQSKNKD